MAIALEGWVAPATWSPLRIAADRCKGCELCVAACRPAVLALDMSVVNGLGYHPVRLTDAAACTSCARCAKVCPDAVFTVFAPPRQVKEPAG
jgi:2-oxoglutarate ferredoxin oxidoreductase subunit delta